MTNQPKTVGEELSSALREVLAVHFDPELGSSYWLQRQRELGLDARRDIRILDDLALLGPMDESALACRPIEDFIPRSLLARRSEFIVAETAGTLGRPKFAVHLRQEFESAFAGDGIFFDDISARDIARHEVGGELDAVEREIERLTQ